MKRFLLSIMTLLVTACSTSSETHIKPAELMELLQAEQAKPIIVDVRSGMEYNSGHIPYAKHIPFWQAFSSDALDDLDKQQDIYLYCEHGPRAGISKFAYYLAGFENIRYIEGHMTSWRAAGLPMEQ